MSLDLHKYCTCFFLRILNECFDIKALYIGFAPFCLKFHLDILAITSNGNSVLRMDSTPLTTIILDPVFWLNGSKFIPPKSNRFADNTAACPFISSPYHCCIEVKYLIISDCLALLYFGSLFLHSILSILPLEYLKAISTRLLFTKALFASLLELSWDTTIWLGSCSSNDSISATSRKNDILLYLSGYAFLIFSCRNSLLWRSGIA